MKIIKPIALKEAKILSNEEMKLLFGGSGGDSGLTAKCNENAACTVSSGGCGSFSALAKLRLPPPVFRVIANSKLVD